MSAGATLAAEPAAVLAGEPPVAGPGALNGSGVVQTPKRPLPAPALPPPPRVEAAALQNKQAVVETTAGTLVMEFYAAEAPRHVAYFLDRIAAVRLDGERPRERVGITHAIVEKK